MKFVRIVWCGFVNVVSGEWIISFLECPNGGGTIAARAVWSSFCICVLVHLFHQILNPLAPISKSYYVSKYGSLRLLSWFGTIFAGVYTALYARFASQWTYLSHVYNEIKKVEASGVDDPRALDEWKADFMEDAVEVQLATKAVFASVIKLWGEKASIKQKFIDHPLGGETRYFQLMGKVTRVCAEHSQH